MRENYVVFRVWPCTNQIGGDEWTWWNVFAYSEDEAIDMVMDDQGDLTGGVFAVGQETLEGMLRSVVHGVPDYVQEDS